MRRLVNATLAMLVVQARYNAEHSGQWIHLTWQSRGDSVVDWTSVEDDFNSGGKP